MPKQAPIHIDPDQWLQDTQHLSNAACRAYMDVLVFMWTHSPDKCSMPDTDMSWRQATRIREDKDLFTVRGAIMNRTRPLLVSRREDVVCPMLRDQAEQTLKVSEARRLAAESRWSKEGKA